MKDYKEIVDAKKLLALGDEATLEDIKNTYRKLSLKCNPDRCKDDKKKYCQEMFQKISHANDILMNYCACYRYSFKEKDVKRNVMDQDLYNHLNRFYDGWLGNLDL